MWLRVLLLMLCTLPGGLRAEANVGLVTIVEGDVFVTRESSRLGASEGMRIAAEDIVESTPQTKLVRIEFGDGLILDLGPATRVLVSPKFPGERGGSRSARLYLLQGWAKVTLTKGKGLEASSVAGESFDLSGIARDVVVNVEPGSSAAFAESGEVLFTERVKGKAAAPIKLKVGEFVGRNGEAKAAVAPRPTADFIQRVPRAFLDTLPSRAALFATREVAPKRLSTVLYADVQPWVDAETALRPLFVTRWKALAQTGEFRKGLVAGLRAHPEWDRVLYPEKYLPKPAASAASAYR